MKDADFMRSIDAVGYLAEEPDGPFYRQRSFASEKLVQRLTLDVLHDQVENAVLGFTEVGNADGVGMLDRCRGLCLAFKSRDGFALLKIVAAENVLPDGLYRDVP